MKVLPTFRGYTIDFRLREFRKVGAAHDLDIEFIPFESEQGDALLCAYIRSLSKKEYCRLRETILNAVFH
ncbi:MAG: hypothetical protein ABI947_16965 [Chloroflexota bacterium]